MKKQIKNSSKNDYDYINAIGLIWTHINNETQEYWDTLCNSSSKNNEIFKIIKEFQKKCTYYLKPNKIVYRARGFKNSEFDDLFNTKPWQDLYKRLKAKIPLEKFNFAYSDIKTFFNYLPFLPNYNEIKDIYNEWCSDYQDVKFWGFDKANSGVNYSSKNKEGRLNTKKQHCLYVASNIKTAVAEIRPINGQNISVAEIKILKPLKLYNFTKIFDTFKVENPSKYLTFHYIAQMCSLPNYSDYEYYKPTQKISKFIENLGYDGIIYPSSLYTKGKNILIFENKCIEYDYDKDSATFEILNSNVYIVQNKNFKIEQYKVIH